MSSSHHDDDNLARRFGLEAARDTLGKSTDVDSCMALAVRINGLIGEATEAFQKDGAAIACRAGCNFCCHLRVMVYEHEAIALFRYLGSRVLAEQARVVRKRVLENAAHIGKLGREGRMPSNLACAFLIDGKCSAYEARPAACSGYHSLSKEQCEKAFEHSGAGADPIPVLQALRYVAAALDGGMEQALEAEGLSRARVELHTAVAALIRNPALIQRWRSGRGLTA